MNLSISHRIGAGYIVMMLLLGICGFAGVHGVQNLASSLLFVTGPAWRAGEGGAKSALNIRGEIFKTQQVLLNEISLDQAKLDIKALQKSSVSALEEIETSQLVSGPLIAEVKQLKAEYQQSQAETLALNDRIRRQRRELLELTNDLLEKIVIAQEDTMIFMDENYSNRYVVEQFEDLEKVLSEVHTGILSRNYMLQQIFEGLNVAKQVQALDEQYRQLKPAYDRLIVMMATQKMTGHVDDISKRFDRMLELNMGLVTDYQLFSKAQAQASSISTTLLGRLEQVREQSNQALEGEVNLVSGLVSQSNSLIWGAIIVGYLAALIAIYITYMTVVVPVRNVAHSLQQIGAGKGDLKVSLPEDGASELKVIAIGFNVFVSKIRETITGVADAVDNLGEAAVQLKSISTETSHAISHQQSQTEQAVLSIQDMANSTNDIAQSASSAALAAANADRSSQSGQKEVDHMINAIQHQVDQLEQTNTVIGNLAKGSQRIGSVLGVIDDIAEQTNLLALNAAIEAARAGDKGRGFAVVADEVRTLASNTQRATTEIQSVIEQLQAAADEAVLSVKATLGIAESSVNQAEQAGGSLAEITESAYTISDMNTQIASAASQQSVLAENINSNIQSINLQVKDAKDSSIRINQSTDGLASLAESLQKLVRQFEY